MEWSFLGNVADIQLLTRRNILSEGKKRETVSFLGRMVEMGMGLRGTFDRERCL